MIWCARKTPEQWCGYGSARTDPVAPSVSGPDHRPLCVPSSSFPPPSPPLRFFGFVVQELLYIGGRGPRGRVFKSAFVPLHGAKSDLPKSHRILRDWSSNERSRSPLSIGALHVARGDRIRVLTKVGSKTVSRFPAQSRPLARLVQDDGSRKLPSNGPKGRRYVIFIICLGQHIHQPSDSQPTPLS